MSLTTVSQIIKYVIIGMIIVGLSSLGLALSVAKEELAIKKAELAVVGAKLKEQNESISRLQIDLKAYKKRKPEIVEKIVTKYINTEIKDETCEAYMKAINENNHKFINGVRK